MDQDLKELDRRFEIFKNHHPELSNDELWRVVRCIYDRHKREKQTKKVGRMQKLDEILKKVEVSHEVSNRNTNR